MKSFVNRDGKNDGSIDIPHYKLGVSDLKCEECFPVCDHIFKLDILNPMANKDATRPKDIELGLSCPNHIHFCRYQVSGVALLSPLPDFRLIKVSCKVHI